jgi:hypothetical protein
VLFLCCGCLMASALARVTLSCSGRVLVARPILEVRSKMSNDIEHYKQRMRDMLEFVQHKGSCAYTAWAMRDHFQPGSCGPMPSCTCGASAIVFIVRAEVGTNEQPVR